MHTHPSPGLLDGPHKDIRIQPPTDGSLRPTIPGDGRDARGVRGPPFYDRSRVIVGRGEDKDAAGRETDGQVGLVGIAGCGVGEGETGDGGRKRWERVFELQAPR